MADLSFLYRGGTVDAIDRAIEEADEPRNRLGLSEAGHDCKRYLWLKHRGAVGRRPDGRIYRLFEFGNMVERQIIGDLSMIGALVYHAQREVELSMDGVTLFGHIDGIVVGLLEAPRRPHLLECKSASRKSFEALIKLASYQAWNVKYYWQVQFYMMALGLKDAAVFVDCKDDSRRYMERIPYREGETTERIVRTFEAITSQVEPDRLCPRRDFYLAKWCSLCDDCFGPAEGAAGDKSKKWGF